MLKSSPKTTIAGIGGALVAIGAALQDGFDLSVDLPVIVTAVAVAIASFLAKDRGEE